MRQLIFLFLTIFTVCTATAKPVEIVVFDITENRSDNLPRNFRDLSSFGLNAIASGQFSADELKAVRKKYPNDKITIVDLRRESHVFLNGQSVSWRAEFEKSNEGKTTKEIIADENLKAARTRKDGDIIISKVIERRKDSGWYKLTEPMIVEVENATPEEKLVKKYGFNYKRFAVQDHAKPSESELKSMISFIKTLPHDEKIYVHCAVGKGRTTTFLTLLDIIKNGKKVDLEEILKRQNSIGGADLQDTDEYGEWRKNLAEERLKMIEDFYKKETKK